MAHGCVVPAAMGGFAQVVEDEGEPRVRPRGLGGGRELVGQHHEVVDEARVGDGGESPVDVGAQQPARVGFALDLVADALQVAAAGEFAEAGEFVGDVGTGQVGPADDSGDQVVGVGEDQELGGLLGHGDRLDEYGAGDARRARLGFEVRDREVPPERLEFGPGEPVLVPYREVPDVVVGVDGHGSSHTTGRPARAPASE